MLSKLDKNSKRNSLMVCRHWYDTVRGFQLCVLGRILTQDVTVFRGMSIAPKAFEQFIDPWKSHFRANFVVEI